MLRDGSAQQALHGQRCLALLRSVLARLVVLGLGVEASDAEQVEHLLFHLLLRVDDGVDHLLGVAVHRGQVHGEVDLWCARRSGDVHQAVHADVVAGEGVPDVQVAQGNTVHGVLGLQVERRIVGVASEGDGSPRHEVEVFLDDVLDGELVLPMVHHVVAEYVEPALVVVVGSYHPVAVERDVVACSVVHHQLEREVGVGVDEEVDAHVRGEARVVVFLFSALVPAGGVRLEDVGRGVVPVDEASLADGVGACHVVHENGLGVRCGIDVDDGFTALAVDAHGARGEHGAVEGVVAELVGVEA